MTSEEFLELQEGFRAKPYKDSRGNLTFGYGFTNITEDEAKNLLSDRVCSLKERLIQIFPKFYTFSQPRQVALISMLFQLGSFTNFPRFLSAVSNQDWETAANNMLYIDPDSIPREETDWYKQTPKRCLLEAEMIRTGKFL